MLKLYFSGADGVVAVPETLTSGMVGKRICFAFSEEWNGLSKVAVFTAGAVTRDVVLQENIIVIPAEVLQTPMRYLYVGVYGVSADGSLVIPTIRVKGPFIEAGTDPSGDPALTPAAAVWEQVLGAVGDLTALRTENKDSLVEAVNELKETACDMDSIGDLEALNTQVKDNLVEAINELEESSREISSIGDLAALNTQAKDNLVDAINELSVKPNEGVTEEEKSLLLYLLKHAVYQSNVSQTMTQLTTLWSETDTGEDVHNHSYTAVITKAATCTDTGMRTCSCICGESYTEVIPATGHNYVEGVCSVCGEADPDYKPEVALDGISVEYSGGSVDAGTAVSSLTGIVVTASYSDGSTVSVTGYTLDGTIVEGSNTITVSYGGFTDTFTVIGNAVEAELVTYTVTNNLTNVTSNNSTTSAQYGSAYTATLSTASGYNLDAVTVTMGGADVTAEVYADGTITIGAVTGDIIITASAAAVSSEPVLLYNWDLTSSLTDTVSGATATLSGGAAQNESGMTISGTNGSCYFGDDIFSPGRTVEIDVASASYTSTSGSGFFVMTGTSGSAAHATGTEGLTFRNKTVWQLYIAGAWQTVVTNFSDAADIAGKTVRFCSNSATELEVYFDDTLVGTYSGTTAHKTQLQLGSATTAFCTVTVSAVRVYGEGV